MMPLPLCTRATMVLFIVLTSQVLVAAMAATPATKGGVLVMGATGYIGKAVVQQLVSRGLPVTAFVQQRQQGGPARALDELSGAKIFNGNVCDASDVRAAMQGCDSVISCISSRSGSRKEVWEIDYGASKTALDVLEEQGGKSYVLLSAICVKTPELELHRAKLKMEEDLKASSIEHAVSVRPSAYFKSVAAQVPTVVSGQPYILFGDGTHTRSNPIGQNDLAARLVDSLDASASEFAGSSSYHVIEIGGAADPLTPRQQSEIIFELAGRGTAEHVSVPLVWLDRIVNALDASARALPFETLAEAAESARIARFYATEDMLGPSDPRYAAERLVDFYEERVSEERAKLVAAKAGATDDDLGLPATSKIAGALLRFVEGFRGRGDGGLPAPAVLCAAGVVAVVSAFQTGLAPAPAPLARTGLLLAESAEHFHRVIS